MKRKAAIIFLCIFIFTLTGCNLGTGIEGLLKPPRLSDEQVDIMSALYDNIGKNIRLKYPKTGENRSAVLIANIDGEPTDEAIVFYEKIGMNVGESTIRMNILDRKDDKWVSAFDHAGSGTEVDRVRVTKFGESSTATLVVGYSSINQMDKNVNAYFYNDGTLLTLFSEKYSAMEILDMDNDSQTELVLISGNATTPWKGKLIKMIGGKFALASEVDMDAIRGDYINIVKGNVNGDTPGLFIDSNKGLGQIQTQILYCISGQLKNPLVLDSETLNKTLRPTGYSSIDFDDDGIVEIPVLTPFPGYEKIEDSRKLNVTEWMVFEKYTLVKKASSYYNINEKFCFVLPTRWQGTVTVREDTTTGEIIFFKFDTNVSSSKTELMRIYVSLNSTTPEQAAAGYTELVTSNNNFHYLIKNSEDTTEPLVLTQSEIDFNFYAV